MSKKECFTIECPCGFEVKRCGRGSNGGKEAWKNAVESYLAHQFQQGGPSIDPHDTKGRQEVFRRVVNLVAGLSV